MVNVLPEKLDHVLDVWSSLYCLGQPTARAILATSWVYCAYCAYTIRMNPGSEASQGDEDGEGGCYLPTLRCSDVPLYDSVVDIHAHGLPFPPTLVVVGVFMLKRWIVQ